MSQSSDAFAVLRGSNHVRIRAVCKIGEEVSTHAAFSEENGKLYVSMLAGTNLVKCIRKNSRVQLAPCTSSGKVVGLTMEAVARVLPRSKEALAIEALKRKYIGLRASKLLSKLPLFGEGEKKSYLEISPV